MSIALLTSSNNFDLFCNELRANVLRALKNIYTKKITSDELEVLSLLIDTINVNNAIVNTAVTTPHINSGTSLFNTVDTETINALSGEILTLNSNNFTSNVINTTDISATGAELTSLVSLTADIASLSGNTMQYNNGTFTNLNAQNLDSQTITTNNITVNDTLTSENAQINNLSILTSLDTPSLTTQDITTNNITVNDTVTTQNINSVNADFSNLTINAAIETPEISTNIIKSLNTGNVTFNDSVIGSDVTLSSSLISPNVRTNNVTTTTGLGNINIDRPIIVNGNINGQNISVSGTGNIPSIVSSTGSIADISGTTLLYNNGTIPILNGNGITYDTGTISDLTTKDITIQNSIVSCPSATIDNLTITNDLALPTIKVDAIDSFSGGVITFNQDVVSDATRISAPEIATNFIDSYPAGGLITARQTVNFLSDGISNTTFIAPTLKCLTLSPSIAGNTITCNARVDFTGGNCTNTTSYTSPLVKTDSLDTASDASIAVLKPISVTGDIASSTQVVAPVVRLNSIESPAGIIFINKPISVTSVSTAATTTTDLTVTNAKVITMTTPSGSGNITFARPFTLPNITAGFGTNVFQYYAASSGSLIMSGAVGSGSLTYRAVRVGSTITLVIQCSAALTTTSSSPLILTNLASQYYPGSNPVRGLCQVNSLAGGATGSYYIQTSGQINIYANNNNGNFTPGVRCGLFGDNTDYATFTYITDN